MQKIYLRAGHGGLHIGTAGNGLVEKHETLRHILSLADELMGYDIEVKLARTSDVTVNLSDSIREANNWGADLYYSSHINGFHDRAAYGYESYIYTAPSEESLRVQNTMHEKQAAVWVKAGSRDRGKKSANFAELRETWMAAILLENGFLTNSTDAAQLKDNNFLAELTKATALAFVDLYGLESKENISGKADTWIVKPGNTMQGIASLHHFALAALAAMNPHITDLSYLEVGDIIYLSHPTDFEIQYARLNRELLLCRKQLKNS